VATPVLLCATPARYYLKRLLEPFLPKVVVLSPLEVPPWSRCSRWECCTEAVAVRETRSEARKQRAREEEVRIG
jgi:hypothetical protein